MISQTNKKITVKARIEKGENEYGEKEYLYVNQEMDALVAFGATGMDYGTDRVLMTTQATVYLPKDKVLAPGFEMLIDGKRYRQDGEALIWDAPSNFSITTGQVVLVKKVDG